MLRVIAGEYGGRRLRAPRGLSTRPTADRVREALFNILPPPAAGSVALDLFAGSGALGIEALSRGAALAIFVDHDPAACRTLRGNLAALSLLPRAVILQQRVERALPRLLQALPDHPTAAPPFAYVFVDAPYKDVASALPGILRYFGEHAAALLGPTGILVAEHDRRDELPGLVSLPRFDVRRYGDTALSFFSAPLSEPASLLPTEESTREH